MIPGLASRFIEYEMVKEIWEATQKYHSKNNDRAKIAQLVNREAAPQQRLPKQSYRSVLTYSEKLRGIYSELDHYRP